MKNSLIALITLLTFNTTTFASIKVLMKTNYGEITIELDEKKAPFTTANFLSYVNDKYYDGLIFHRVMDNFMIQGGGFQEDMVRKPAKKSIENEANNGLSNLTGTIAMARTGEPHSATSQFFINTQDNSTLDYTGSANWGYCVFGKVVKGMTVVNRIRKVKTGKKGPYANVPLDPVSIQSVRILK
jgi:cyclophilin family peptidyl-prolyl cis-trans isomerase